MINEQKSDLEKYYILKSDLKLPVKLRLYLMIFENALNHAKSPKTIEEKEGFSKALLQAFTNLSVIQKGQYMLSNINFIIEQLDSQQKEKTKSDSKVQSDEIVNVQTSCEMLLTALKFNYWATVSLKLDKMKKLLSITNKKKCFAIDMKNYFVRKSHKYKHAVVLQAITESINNEGKKYVFSFSHQIVGKIYQQMLKCCFNCQHQKILTLLTEDDIQQNDQAQKQSHHSNDKTLVFLNSKNINDYLAYKQKVEKQIMQNRFQFKNLYTNAFLKIDHSSRIEKVFRMQNCFDVDSKELKEKFLYAFNHKNKFVLETQLLQDFSKKYKAVYEKLNLNGKTYEYISIREESIFAQEQTLFLKGVQNILGKNYIEFIQVRVRTLNPCQSKLIIYISISLNPIVTKQVVKTILIELNEMIYRKSLDKKSKNNGKPKVKKEQIISLTQANEEAQKSPRKKIQQLKDIESQRGNIQKGEDLQQGDDFTTVKGNDSDSEDFVGIVEGEEDGDCNQYMKSQRQSETSNVHNVKVYLDIGTSLNQNQKSYLSNKFTLEPISCQKYHIYMKQHYLFKDWQRVKAGGVICTNEVIVANQKKLFKMGIAKLGKKILKGELLKISLPVSIFSEESHLHSIARNFSYAPMFFDEVASKGNSLERVKYATLQAISVGTLGISMQKPFNPILGETLQMRIDGCPIYLEQICHHPPVGAYYLQGRGYRIHGKVQPKISFGLNNIKGFSSRPNFIQFDDGTLIQIIFGKMVIKGMLFGDRQFCYEDKIYAYDKVNHLFSQIIYGPRKKSQNKNDPLDYVHGSIFRLKPQFLPIFNKSMPRVYPSKEYIIQTLSTFGGIWSDEVCFDDKPYINFKENIPFAMVPQQHPLPSDSSFRTDIKVWITKNEDEAQKQKQRLEEIQRRDKKLRQKVKH